MDKSKIDIQKGYPVNCDERFKKVNVVNESSETSNLTSLNQSLLTKLDQLKQKLEERKAVIGNAVSKAGDFRIVVKTDNAGVSNNDQFQFTGALGDYDVEVYDSTGTTLQETITGLSNTATITIAAGAGTYELRVFPAATNGFNRIQFNNGGDKDKLIEIRNWGDIVWSTMDDAFFGCSNLVSVTSQVAPNFDNVINFGLMFYLCTDLATLDLSNFATPSAGNMRFMFSDLLDVQILDVSNFVTSGVGNMGFMFNNLDSITDIIGIENLDISNASILTNFLESTVIPTARYDQLLINYEAQVPNNNINFSGGGSTYTLGGAAEAARTSLETTYNWTISDGGGV